MLQAINKDKVGVFVSKVTKEFPAGYGARRRIKLQNFNGTTNTPKAYTGEGQHVVVFCSGIKVPKELCQLLGAPWLNDTINELGKFAVFSLDRVLEASPEFKEEWGKAINTTMIGKTALDLDYSESLGCTKL